MAWTPEQITHAEAAGAGVTTGAEKVVRLAFGRVRVKPVVLASWLRFNHREWQSFPKISGGQKWVNMSDVVDCVLAIAQPGITIRGVWRGDDYAGLRLRNTGSWTSNGVSVEDALLRLGACQEVGGYWTHNNTTTSSVWVPGTTAHGLIEVVTAASGPTWGRKMASNGTWSDLTGSAGTTPPAWAYLAGGDAEGQAFAGVSHIRFEKLSLARDSDLLPDIQFLVDGVGGQADCPPDDAIRYVLVELMGYDDTDIITNVGPDGLAASGAVAYWDAMSSVIKLNAFIDGNPTQALEQILEAVNCTLVQSGGKIKIYPLGDSSVGSYVPTSTAYEIGPEDLSAGTEIEVESRDPAECYNVQEIVYKDAVAGFKERHYTYRDPVDAAASGDRPADDVTNDWVSTSAHAKALAQWKVAGYLRNRRRVTLKLMPHFGLLEPGDLLVVSDGHDLPEITCRIVDLDEDDDFSLDIEAWEWSGACHPVDLTPDVILEPVEVPPLQSELEIPEAAADAAHDWASTAETAADTAQDTADTAQSTATAAAADASTALTLAGTKTKVTYSASAPGSPTTGDLWCSTDTTTNCPLSTCPGHTLTSSGDVLVGTYPHRSLYWFHRWDGSAWVAASTQAMICAAEIATGAVTAAKIAAGVITADKLDADCLETTNYTEDSDANPTAGAKLDHEGTSLKTVARGLQVGKYTLEKMLTAAAFRSFHPLFGVAVEGGEGGWIAASSDLAVVISSYRSNGYFVKNGSAVALTGLNHHGAACWDEAAGVFLVADDDKGLVKIERDGTATVLHGECYLDVAYDPNSYVAVALRGDIGTTNARRVYGSGASSATVTLPTSATWLSVNPVIATGADATHASYGWLAVGHDGSGHVVLALGSTDGSTWQAITLPDNTGTSLSGARTSDSTYNCGAVVGSVQITREVAGVVQYGVRCFVLTNYYVWELTFTGATLSASAFQTYAATGSSWTRRSHLLGSGSIPSRCRCTRSAAMVVATNTLGDRFCVMSLLGRFSEASDYEFVEPPGYNGELVNLQLADVTPVFSIYRPDARWIAMKAGDGSTAASVSGVANEFID